MQSYETYYILNPDLSEEARTLWANKLAGLIQGIGGSIVTQSDATLEPLAYPVAKKKTAVRIRIECMLEPKRMEELSRALHHEQDVLRVFFVKKSKVKSFKTSQRADRRMARDPIEIMPLQKSSIPASTAHHTAPAIAEESLPKKEKVQLEEIDKHLEDLFK